MSNNYDKEITILLGAGTEGCGQLNLPSGASFKRDIILANGVTEFTNCIFRDSSSNYKITDDPILQNHKSSILYQTLLESRIEGENERHKSLSLDITDNENNIFKDERIIKNIEILFEKKEDQRVAYDYIRYKQGLLNEGERERLKSEKIWTAFQKLYRENFYNIITSPDYDKGDHAIADIFLRNVGFFSYLDGNFNYLRAPEIYIKECMLVIRIYYSAYLSILRGIISTYNEQVAKSGSKKIDNLIEYLTNSGKDKSSAEFIKKLNQLLNMLQERISVEFHKDKSVYYNQIANCVEKYGKIRYQIVTTNYTDFADRMTGIESKDIVHVHGRLDMFEDIESKNICKIDEIDMSKTIFPYILIPSGVKPIIGYRQIKDFYNAAEMIIKSDILLVLGYGLNLDDEHILNLIRERYRQNKDIYFFIYETGDYDSKIKNYVYLITGEDREKENIHFYRTTEFEMQLDRISKENLDIAGGIDRFV